MQLPKTTPTIEVYKYTNTDVVGFRINTYRNEYRRTGEREKESIIPPIDGIE